MVLRLVNAKTSLTVGRQLSDGGQGLVFAVQRRPGWVFKQYKPEVLKADHTLESRIRAMVSAPPAGTRDVHGHTVLTWPIDLVTSSGRFIGFVMPRIDVHEAMELHEVTNPTSASGRIPWKAKVAIASNLVRATRMVHTRNVVVGDFHDRNVLVWKTGLVTLLDCDSMQIQDSRGRLYYCRVGRPEFVAPELQGRDWRSTVRAESSDLFALAIHLHQLLLQGESPFGGVWHGRGEKPPAQAIARDGEWVYGKGRLLTPRPSAPSIDLVTPEIKRLFHRAFVDGASQPQRRPTTDEWSAALTTLESEIQQCRKKQSHYYRRGLSNCPWCARDRRSAQQAAARATTSKTPAPARKTPQPQPRAQPQPPRQLTQPVKAAAVPKEVPTRRLWIGVIVLLATVLAPYFLGRVVRPAADLWDATYRGVPLRLLLGWYPPLQPSYLVGTGVIIALAALWSMRPARWDKPMESISSRRAVIGLSLLCLGLLMTFVLGPRRSADVMTDAKTTYANGAIASTFGPPICDGISTWTSSSGTPVATWRAEQDKDGTCTRIRNYVGWRAEWRYKTSRNASVSDFAMYGGVLIAHVQVEDGWDYLVALSAPSGNPRWTYECPTRASSDVEFHNADDNVGASGSYRGVQEFVRMDCGNQKVRIRVTTGRRI